MRIRGLALLLSLLVAACGREATPNVASDVAVDVASVAFDPRAQSPVLILSERQGTRRLPIWIGAAEARSIAQRLDDVSLPRPNTHDLARRLVEGLDGVVQRVTVTDLRDGTYYAVIALQRNGRDVEIDARPSDAIALALRAAAPVFVREKLFETVQYELEKPDDAETERHARRTRTPPARVALARWNPDGID
jgi:bifunctional DNase/RNase